MKAGPVAIDDLILAIARFPWFLNEKGNQENKSNEALIMRRALVS